MSIIDRLIEADRESPKRILVVGDAMTDVYLHGYALEDCQEKCPKFVVDKRVEVPGGAANAARSLENWNTQTSCLYVADFSPIKTRYMVANKCVFRHDDDHRGEDFGLARKATMVTLRTWRPHGVLISDYDKRLLTPEMIREVIRECVERRIPCVADAKRSPAIYDGAILKCNEVYQHKYNRELSGMVYDAAVPRHLVVTAGPLNPAVWAGGSIQHGFPFLPPVECVNHVGAGDCFGAHLVLGLVYGLSIKEAAAVAHSAGRAYVQRAHNAPPEVGAIRADMLYDHNTSLRGTPCDRSSS